MALRAFRGYGLARRDVAGGWGGEARCILIGGLAALVVAIFWRSFASMFDLYGREAYRHGFLVLPIAGFMLMKTRAKLTAAPIAPWWPGLLLVGAVVVLWLVACAAAVQAVEHAAAVVAIPVVVLAVLGLALFRAASFPLLFTLLSVPVGDNAVPWLRESTADVASLLLRVSGIPVYREGMYLSLPGGNFEIADACAGLNYMTAGIAFALLFAWLSYREWKTRAIFVGCAFLLFLVGNAVRAYIVMAVASATNMRWLAGHDHIVFGTILFCVLIVLLALVGRRYADAPGGPEPADASRGAAASAGKLAAAAVAAGLLLQAGPAAHAYRAGAARVHAVQLALPRLADCAGPGPWSGDWDPVMHDPDSEVRGVYDCGGIAVQVFAVQYVNQTQGRELVSAGNTLVPDEWSAMGSRSDVALELGGEVLAANEVVRDGSRPLLAWYWYSVGGETARSGTGAKLLEVRAALVLEPAVSSAYLIAARGTGRGGAELRAAASRVASAVWAHADGAP